MILYYSPGACSQAPHILMHEIGISHDAARVDLRSKTLEDGSSYLEVNPKGAVPALQLSNGDILTENAVILQYLGDRAGSPDVLAPQGDFRRYRQLELVNFITTELHKRFGFLFNPRATDEMKQLVVAEIGKKLGYLEAQIGAGPFLMGDTLTLADPYLFVITGWTGMFMDLARWPNLAAFRERMMQRPSVRNVLRFEGLLEEEVAG
ncbi:MAG: glutathione transferase GstA [Sphingomicrobium sp.]